MPRSFLRVALGLLLAGALWVAAVAITIWFAG
jgi:hypothetical protein